MRDPHTLARGIGAAPDREAWLRGAIEDLADQLCVTVDGDFDFLVRSSIEDETLEKLAMLINFVLDTARRGMGALRQHNAVLAQLDQAKTVFFSNASHELRTPLTLLLGPMEDAMSQPGGALAGEPLAAAHRNAMRLLKLVNALLEFSRIEAGRLQPAPRPTDLAVLTADVAALFRPAIERAGLRMWVDCPALPERIFVDPDMWEKIVANLLSNAYKFTFEGEISVRVRLDDSHAILEVSDTGVGIGADHLGRLFERFHRIEGARSRTHEGTGIGLAMVHELAKLHGGRVEVTSRPGAGSMFRVFLPRDRAYPAAAAAPSPAAGKTAQAFVQETAAWSQATRDPVEAGTRGTAKSRERVIIADDNADMRAYLLRILEPHWNVDAFTDGAQALAAARLNPPDVVVCDVMMPNMNGFELLRALRSEPRTHMIPVILLSARADQESVIDGFEAGTDDYLVKPFAARELLARVRSRLEMSRLRMQLYEREHAARAQAEAANRAKDQFLAMLGHELRNPLAPIVTALQVMEMKGDETTRKERAVIGRQLAHVTRLVDDLLDVSRIIRGLITLQVERVDIARTIAKAVETASPLLEQRHHGLKLSVPEELFVEADATRLAQVFSNLLANAAKFTDPGGLVEVEARRDGSDVVVSVRDSGIGLEPSALDSIFEAFVQGEQSIDRSKGGLGLGLAIVRSLVRLHGGRVEARSEGPGRGSEFVVRLPAAPATARAQAKAPGPAFPSRTTRPARVLIVDDNLDAAHSLSSALTMLGHITCVAEDGPSGLRAAARFHPEVAILDIGLPVMDGYELARRLLETSGPGVKLVALTGYGEKSDVTRAHAAGFVEHLVKPADIGDVARLVERLALASA